MNDNIKRYFAILCALRQGLKSKIGTHADHHVVTLAAIISGIIGSKSCQLPAIASKISLGGKRPSREKRCVRWLQQKGDAWSTYYFPFVPALLNALPEGPFYMVMDGSEVGKGCMTLMLSVIYQGRALPLVWTVVKKKKGHFPADMHIALFEQIKPFIGNHPLVFLGDGEFDSVQLLTYLRDQGYQYVCRTAKNILVSYDKQDWIGFEDLAAESDFKPGDGLEFFNLYYTAEAFKYVNLVAVWEKNCEEPIYLVTNLPDVKQAYAAYSKRFRIETFFSDQKSRGFHIHKSHLSDPGRLARLIVAASLAYCWLVCLGADVRSKQKTSDIHRKGRCDLSNFQIGLIWLEECLNRNLPILVYFYPIPNDLLHFSVRY